MSRFQALKDDISKAKAPSVAAATETLRTANSRAGKRTVAGHFSEGVSKALNRMAVDEGKTVQALLGEAIDLLMRDRGKHPFGER